MTKMKIVCMLPVFNNVDFIEEVIEHLLSQGLNLVILDDGSTDGTFEICKKYSNRDDVELLQVIHKGWQNIKIIRTLYHMALLKSPNWVIRSDSDEVLESGMKDMTLRDAIIKVDSEGNNIIQFDCFEFFLTDNDDKSTSKITDKIKYYSWQHDFLYRAWKVSPGISPELGWGHIPVFPEYQKYKIYPKKFVLRHYRFRSIKQVQDKIKSMISRTKDTTEGKLGIHIRYNRIAERKNNSFILDHNKLTKYNNDNKWNYERKFYPYIQKIPRTKDEVFNPDGSLKMKILDIAELRLESKKVNELRKKLRKKLQNQIEQNETLKKKNLEQMRKDLENS